MGSPFTTPNREGAVIDVRIRRMRIDELDALLSTYNQGISGSRVMIPKYYIPYH